jgi:hypothetical protein
MKVLLVLDIIKNYLPNFIYSKYNSLIEILYLLVIN